jgi:formiminotetrahydrofolate cyclodeaminase
MNEEITKLGNCLKAMKKCLKIPHVEDCVCFSDAIKVLDLEINVLYIKIANLTDIKEREKATSLKNEIGELKKKISKNKKECLGCSVCMASVVFKAYPEKLNSLYLENEL